MPAAIWCVARVPQPRKRSGRRRGRRSWCLVLINLTGRNLGEVARLWMLFMPPLLLAAGAVMNRLGAQPRLLWARTIALLGVQTLALQTMIQVVYPV